MTTTPEAAADPARDGLRAHVEARDPEAIREDVTRLRRELEAAFHDRALTPGSVLLERKRRLHQRLDEVREAAHAGAWDRASEVAAHVAEQHASIVAEARDLPAAEGGVPQVRLPAGLRNALTVARKELVVALQGGQGLVLFGLFLLTFAIGLETVLGGGGVAGDQASVTLVWNYAHSLDFLTVPLAGVLLGHGLVNAERASRTIHFLASKPVSRGGIVLGKWLGMAGALALLIGVTAGLVGGVAYGVTGSLGDPAVAVGYVLATYAVALAFGSIGLAISTVLDRSGASLLAGFGAYLVLGPVWQNVFLTSQLQQGGGSPPVGQVLVYLASPFTAWWNLTSELLGPTSDVLGMPVGEPWHAVLVEQVERGVRESLPFYATTSWYALVLVLWSVLGLTLAGWVMSRRDLS